MLIAESPVQMRNWAVAETPAVSGASSLLDQIGNTPLLDLSDFAHSLGVAPGVGIYVKAEWTNPGGSVKARTALGIVEEAERSGKLTPGKVLIDSSSGNTGIAYALLGEAITKIRPATISVVARIGGLLLATIGVQMMLGGLDRFFA